jgi:hypothetical protein
MFPKGPLHNGVVRSRLSRSLALALALGTATPGCRGHVDTAKGGDGTTPTAATTSTSTANGTPTPTPTDASADADPPDAAPPAPELPGGGRTLFPARRLIGYCGTPGAPALGGLLGNLPRVTKSMKAFADKFPTDRKPLLVFELIVVVVQSYEGADKKYRRRVDDSVVDDYLKAAREAEGILLLNIQPGQSDFMTELKHYEKYLHEPDVGVALDPEWAVKAKQKPGVYYGNATGAQINEIADYLAGIVKEDNLPEKALVFHQLNRYVVTDESVMVDHPGVVLIKSVDGLGPKHAKLLTYADLMKTMAPVVHPGFKLFLDEDARIGGHVMGPKEVMALTPPPEYVMVE